MRILFVALEVPYPLTDGGRLRTFHFLDQLSKEHEVLLLTFDYRRLGDESLTVVKDLCTQFVTCEPPPRQNPSFLRKLINQFSTVPIAIRNYYTAEMDSAVRKLLAAEKFDLIHLDQIYMAQYIPESNRIPVVFNHNDVDSLVQERARELLPRHRKIVTWLEHQRWRRYEIKTTRRFEISVVVSKGDESYFQHNVPQAKTVIVPNGVDIINLITRPDPGGPPTILYVGSMSYFPNVDAVNWFHKEILPLIRMRLPDIEVIIVGRRPPEEISALNREPGITVTGTVDSVVPYYQKAHVQVVPIRIGGGSRLKILESMALGVPVVSTTIGCEGLDVTNGLDMIVGDEPVHIAAAIIKLLNDSKQRMEIAEHARETVETKYSWDEIGRKLMHAYHLALN